MERRRLRVWDLSQLTPGFFLMAAALIFALGLLSGFLLSGRMGSLADTSAVRIVPSAPVTTLQFWGVFWSHFRWLLFGALLAMSALGLFLLYPLVFFRGLLFGFSFSALFSSGDRLGLVVNFFLTALFTCSPLLFLAAAGMARSLCELRRGASGEESFLTGPAAPLLLLLLSFVLTLLCCFAELWLLPGFVSHIQPFTA